MKYPTLFFFIIILPLFQNCIPDKVDGEQMLISKELLTIRLNSSPDRLMPFLSQSAQSGQIEKLLYASLSYVDYETLELIPYLAEENAVISSRDSFFTYDYTIRKEARWDNGKHITAKDVLFSLKWAINGVSTRSGIASYVSLIDSVLLYPDNERKMSFWLNESYILAEEAIGLLPIIPQYFFDPQHVFDQIPLSQIQHPDAISQYRKIVTQTENSARGRDSISGAGPYILQHWESNQRISLRRKTNWWGDNVIEKNTALTAQAENIDFVIVKDDVSARILLLQKKIDILTNVNPHTFTELKNTKSDSFHFYQPLTSSYYYVALNNGDPLLQYIEIRKALNSLIDKKQFIEVQLDGYAQPIYGPIHPSIKYASEPIKQPQSIAYAQSVLHEAGWKDTNNNGVVDKVIHGKNQELSLTMNVSSGELGQTIALIMQQEGKKIGIDIDIITSNFSLIRAKLSDKSYQMTPLRIKTSGFIYDPYQSWHSDNVGKGKPNYTTYRNKHVDSLIEDIRFETNGDALAQLYKQFQVAVSEDVPVIFLAAPKELIITQKDITLETSSVFPGYDIRVIQSQ